MVPEDHNLPNIGMSNIFEDCGSRTLEQVAGFKKTYLAQQNRNAQFSKILFDIIFNSLSTAGQCCISICKSHHSLELGNTHCDAGVCLLKSL